MIDHVHDYEEGKCGICGDPAPLAKVLPFPSVNTVLNDTVNAFADDIWDAFLRRNPGLIRLKNHDRRAIRDLVHHRVEGWPAKIGPNALCLLVGHLELDVRALMREA